MHWHRPLDVVDVAHQAHVVVGAGLVRDVHRHPAGHDRRGMCVPAAEQAVHLPGVTRHLERLQVEVAGERVKRPHDVGDRLVAVDVGVRRRVDSAFCSSDGFVSLTICSQKSTFAMQSLKIAWSNM